MSSFLFDPLTMGLEQVLDLRVQQHALTASNLANADTPGFRARVIDFDGVLAEAVGQGGGLQMARGAEGHLSKAGSTADPEIIELDPSPWSENGNSVLLERETARLNANSLMYRGLTRGLSKRLALLKYAASDGKR